MRPVDNIGVLFVDDDIDLLYGINRVVHVRYPQWKLFFAASPLDAFRNLKEESDKIDIIVCDIHLPYLSGVKILKLVMDDFPHIVRMTLSGKLDGASLTGSKKYSECHICKPVHANMLYDKIITTYANRHEKMK